MTDMSDFRTQIAELGVLAKRLFEQQFIRAGGRKPADPTWDDLDDSERDDWWDRAKDAAPLLAEAEAEAVANQAKLPSCVRSTRGGEVTTEEAIAIVAERAIWAATREIEWADYGDIGEHDWNCVLREIDRRVHVANLELYSTAYDLLASLATGEANP